MPRTSLDETMSALADPTRRAILAMLHAGESRVTDIAAPFDMSFNAVSKHIKLLERAQLVRRRKIGREHFISFNPAPLEPVSAWLDEMRKFWAGRLDALEAALDADDKKNRKG